jgi:hypothetical protein
MNAAAEMITLDTRTPGIGSAERARYARAISASKKVRWDIDADVIRGRNFDYSHKFLPDGLSLVRDLEFLTEPEARLWSHVQGRTYAYIFGLVERYIGAKVLELSGQHWLGDQVALEALVRFGDEEIKHQELFRRLEVMFDARMPAGYVRCADPNDVARAVLSKSTWSILALTCMIELFVQSHYEESIAPDGALSPLYKDVFTYHWREECQHAILDEMEWRREHERLDDDEKDRAVTDLIELAGAVDGILQAQAAADASYFTRICHNAAFTPCEQARIYAQMLKAYRWQYVVSGVQHPHFQRLLTSMTTPAQMSQIVAALQPILASFA